MYDEVVQNFRHTGFQTDPTHWFENPAWEREEQDGLGGRRTRDTKCERERERMMVERKKAKIINHLSNAREVHGPLMADFEMDWSKFTIFFAVKYYGKVQKMAGCGRLADWSTPPPPDQPYPTRQPDVKHFPDAKKKQEKSR
ncbi:hypothetical protein B0H14DRAFT_2589623 [Mycena olivaceomarginata]|nr:hypothetical protein B0H14DRAFT_2589623 [Mycena olivaceomarginata]